MPAAKLIGEPSRLIQMYDIANVEISFGICNTMLKNNQNGIVLKELPCLLFLFKTITLPSSNFNK